MICPTTNVIIQIHNIKWHAIASWNVLFQTITLKKPPKFVHYLFFNFWQVSSLILKRLRSFAVPLLWEGSEGTAKDLGRLRIRLAGQETKTKCEEYGYLSCKLYFQLHVILYWRFISVCKRSVFGEFESLFSKGSKEMKIVSSIKHPSIKRKKYVH